MKQDRRPNIAVKSIACCAASFIAVQGMASAGPVTEAGELCGLAMGAPLPPGFYFVDTASIVELGKDYHTNLYVNIPVLAWSTPWTIGTGRIEAYVAVPEIYIGVKGGTSTSAIYNPALLVGMAWNLGDGWGFSNFVGGYAPTAAPALSTQDEWVFNERAALSYTGNGYNFTVHITYGVTGNNERTGVAHTPDYINYDITATKTYGKWEVGPVGFGTSDLSNGSGSHLFELGALGGYNFGGLTGQVYLTHSVSADKTSYGDGDTRFFARVIVPL